MYPHLWSRLAPLSPSCPAVHQLVHCFIKTLTSGAIRAGATGFTGSNGDTGSTGASGFTGKLGLQVAPDPFPWPPGLFSCITL
jgi:hypothetical protein